MNYIGVLHRYLQKVIPDFGGNSKTVFEPVIVEQVVQIHVILFCGIFISIGFTALEVLRRKRQARRNTLDIIYIGWRY